jgi:hypothetical protein
VKIKSKIERLLFRQKITGKMPVSLSGAVGRTFERFESEFASNNLFKRDVREGGARARFDHRPMPQAKLTHSLGDNIDQELLVRDHLSCFLEKLSRHITQ